MLRSRYRSVAGNARVYQLPMFNWVQRGTHARFDPFTPAAMLCLGLLGLVFIHSAQAYSGDKDYLKQIVWISLGAVCYLVVSLIDYKIVLKYSHWIWIGGMLGLLALEIPGIGRVRYSAKSWIDFGPISLQPSEGAKIAILVMSCSILARTRVGEVKSSALTLTKLALAAGLPMLLIMKQPDLGSALVIPPMVLSLLYASNLTKRFFVAMFLAGVLAAGAVVWDTYRYNSFLVSNNLSPRESARGNVYAEHSWLPYLKDYQRNRILPLIASDTDGWRESIAWNLHQSLITVGSGGFFGKGLGEGTQARLGYLPPGVAHNDFIFSVLAEETGFVGSVAVLGLFGLILANGVRIASKARDRFGTLLALGVTTVFAVHVFVNIGMTIGLLPITGLPLPFLSYGGSFMLSCCILQGLVQSVYRFRKDF